MQVKVIRGLFLAQRIYLPQWTNKLPQILFLKKKKIK